MTTLPALDPSGPLPAYPLLIHSRILDADIWISPDGWALPAVEGPSYTHSEVGVLDRQQVTPEALRALHLVKVSLDGEVLGDSDAWVPAVTWIPVD